ncbi:MAG: peptidylprolyl isomerase [Eudoraea sp.]|nr:peptidylprolyl isomerase [Eudoraea sp.]
MVTSHGTIVMELYNETPLHRDNFVKLVTEGAYEGLLFHRVIDDFVIQAGDPESKDAKPNAALGNGDVGYTIDAEFQADIFHKRGAIGAARDGNPERASSGIQFYVVQRGVQNDSLLEVAEKRINRMLARHFAYKDPANKSLTEALKKAQEAKNQKKVRQFNEELDTIAKTYSNFEKYVIPETHRQAYKTEGGIPHLDQNYTVFGEVVTGMDVVDSIAKVKTNDRDRPVEDVRIISARLLK